MSELQDALHENTVLNIEAAIYDKHSDLVQPYLDTVKAARRAANPDMEAAANGLEIHLPDAIKPYALRMAQDVVNVALGGTTEADEGDVIGADGEPKWMPGDPDDGPIVSITTEDDDKPHA